jgi:glucose/arabinose dehydrogenase
MNPGRIRTVLCRATAAAIGAGLLVVLPPPLASAAPSLPPGFVLQDVPTGLQPTDPITDFGYLPDESLLVIAKNGKVVWTPQTGAPRELARLSVTETGDMGLIGLAIAPDYAASRVVYTTRTLPPGTPGGGAYGLLRLSKWTVAVDPGGDPTGLTDEVALVDATSDGDSHGMWDVVAAPDGTLWVSIGDSADWRVVDPVALRALDVNDVHGKLLHLRQDGFGVPGNPYYDASAPRAVRSLVYASGVRSPFRFLLQPDTGRLLLGDVGWNSFEELNVVNPGNNYGWPCWEGDERTPGYRDLPECPARSTASPVWSYPHDGGGAVTGGAFYTGASYPAEYRGRYFFGDYVFQKIYTLRLNDRGELVTPPESNGFGRDIGRPVKFATVPTGGDIVYADIGAATVHRLVYAPGNNPPQAAVTSTTDPDTRTVTFDAGDSFDPNGDPLTYRWDFGDGTPPAAGPPTISHSYSAVGPEHFSATVTATDPLGANGSAATTVYPSNHAPVLNLAPPRQDVQFAVGDIINATASATDAEDGPRPVHWSVTLVHCTGIGICHLHPGVQQNGPTFRLVFDGHPGDSHLEVAASATDSRGATTREVFVVRPKQRRVSVLSNTPAAFTIGEEQATTGLFTVGMNLSVVAPASAQDGVASFGSWGDSGSTNRIRQLTVPDADQTLPVSYSTPIDRRYATDATLRSIVGTPVNLEQGDSALRFREYSAGRVYWSPDTGVHFVTGAILGLYLNLGGHLGYGLPTTDETSAPDGVGRYNHFQLGSIYSTPALGAHEVHGAIRDKWSGLGWEQSILGYPITNETPSLDGIGAYNHFEHGSIFWSPATGAHEVHGPIRDRWASLGWEHSYLGYPTSDEVAIPGGTRSFFQRGYIERDAGTGFTTVVYEVAARPRR